MPANEVLESAIAYLRDEVAPAAQEIDREPEALLAAVQGLCERDLMSLRRPDTYGGPALAEDDFRAFQEECARVSGALAFLQTQHQSAVSMMAKSQNETLKSAYLPKMGNGEKLVGIGFSQLRRSGPPSIRATAIEGGYALDGHVPWVTGWDFFPEFVVGATLDDGRAVLAVVPLPLRSSPEIEVGEPMKLAAMEAANTVTVDFSDFFVPDELVLCTQSADWIRNNDQINIALQGHFAIGCAQAGIDILEAVCKKKDLAFIRDATKALTSELNSCRSATKNAQPGAEEVVTEARLKARAWAIDLAVRCAHAAVAASSGAANSLAHPAQRVYREALVYTVSAQTPQIMEATLERLVARGGS